MTRLPLLLGLVCAAPAWGEGLTTLPPVDVPASSEPVDSESALVKEPSGSTAVVHIDTHAGEVKDVAELVGSLPGVMVQDTAGLLQRRTVSIRGGAPNAVVWLFDGIPVGGVGSNVDLSSFPSSLLSRLELLRGSGARFAPGGLSGVVNLVPVEATDGRHLMFEATGGSFSSTLGKAAFSGAVGPGQALLLVHAEQSRGNFSYSGNDGAPAERLNNDAASYGAMGRWRHDFADKWALGALAETTAVARGLAGTVQNPVLNAREESRRGLLGLKLSRTSETLTLDASGWARLQTTRLVGGFAGPTAFDQFDGAAGGSISFDAPVAGRHLFSGSVSLGNEWLVVPNQTNPSRLVFGALGQFEELFFAGDLGLNVSLRADVTGGTAMASPKVGAKGVLPFGFEVAGNVGRGHRPPSFLELNVLQGRLAPNPSLKPETSWFVDAAFSHTSPFSKVQLGGFATLYEQLISYEVYSAQLARPYNFANARVAGLEAQARLSPVSWAALDASYTLLFSQNTAGDARYVGRELPYRPRHRVFARTELGPPVLHGYAELTWQSEQFMNRAGTLSLPARAMVNAGVSARVLKAPDLTASFAMKNAADVTAFDFDGYPLPSRSFFLTLALSYDASPPRSATP